MLLNSAQMSPIQPSLLPGPQYHDSAIGYKHCIYNFLLTTLLVYCVKQVKRMKRYCKNYILDGMLEILHIVLRNCGNTSPYFKGVMTWEIQFPFIFWHIRGICTIKTSCKFHSLKHPPHCKQSIYLIKLQKWLVLDPLRQGDVTKVQSFAETLPPEQDIGE